MRQLGLRLLCGAAPERDPRDGRTPNGDGPGDFPSMYFFHQRHKD